MRDTVGNSFLLRRQGRVRNEPTEMRECRYEYFSRVFRCRGHCYRIHAVERSWTVPRGRHREEGERCFLVHCAEGESVVCQDLTANTWHLARTRDGRKRESRSA